MRNFFTLLSLILLFSVFGCAEKRFVSTTVEKTINIPSVDEEVHIFVQVTNEDQYRDVIRIFSCLRKNNYSSCKTPEEIAHNIHMLFYYSSLEVYEVSLWEHDLKFDNSTKYR